MAIDRMADAALQQLKPENVASSYEGRAGKCACGCSGTYYGPDYTDADEATNRLKVERGLARMQRRGLKDPDSIGTAQFSNGSRCWYYETKSSLFRIQSKPSRKGA
jgi:hypothetical protein